MNTGAFSIESLEHVGEDFQEKCGAVTSNEKMFQIKTNLSGTIKNIFITLRWLKVLRYVYKAPANINLLLRLMVTLIIS